MAETAPLVLLIGTDLFTRTRLRVLLTTMGYAVHEIGQVTDLSCSAPADADVVRLVVLIAPETVETLARTVARLRLQGYAAPLVVVAFPASTDLRHAAFAVDAVDLIALPAYLDEVGARLRAALANAPLTGGTADRMTVAEILAAIAAAQVTDETFSTYHEALLALCRGTQRSGLLVLATFVGSVREYYLHPDLVLRLQRDAYGIWRRLRE